MNTPGSHATAPRPCWPTFLVVDDELDMRQALTDILTLEIPDCHVLHARDGWEALEQLRAGPVHVVILDHRMPRMTGGELILVLREQGVAVPIVFISAAQELPALARQLGVRCYLPKPFDFDDLLGHVQRALTGDCC